MVSRITAACLTTMGLRAFSCTVPTLWHVLSPALLTVHSLPVQSRPLMILHIISTSCFTPASAAPKRPEEKKQQRYTCSLINRFNNLCYSFFFLERCASEFKLISVVPSCRLQCNILEFFA